MRVSNSTNVSFFLCAIIAILVERKNQSETINSKTKKVIKGEKDYLEMGRMSTGLYHLISIY